MHQIFLSKRNLLTLLSKIERYERGEETACTIIKYKNPSDPYVNTMDACIVTALPDDKLYVNRGAGEMHPADEERIKCGTSYSH